MEDARDIWDGCFCLMMGREQTVVHHSGYMLFIFRGAKHKDFAFIGSQVESWAYQCFLKENWI